MTKRKYRRPPKPSRVDGSADSALPEQASSGDPDASSSSILEKPRDETPRLPQTREELPEPSEEEKESSRLAWATFDTEAFASFFAKRLQAVTRRFFSARI
jgi:hypothetical protein